MRSILIVILLLFFSGAVIAQELKVPAIFSDNMVLQQKSDVPIWGWDAPGKVIQVTGSWNNNTVKTVTDNSGKWMIKLSTPSAGGPFTLTINDEKSVSFQNVMIGEVWICSGQSNMEMPMSGWGTQTVQNSDSVIKQAKDYPNIRLFNEQRNISVTLQSDCVGHWVNSSPESVATFSAVGYFFGLELYKRLNIPVGLIMTTWGGTPLEAWTSAEEISKYSDFKPQIAYLTNHDQHIKDSLKYIKELADWQSKVKDSNNNGQGHNQISPINRSAIYPNFPSVLFNGMINPLIPYAVKGAIWYQGESNVNDPKLYGQIFPAMVKCWRSLWNQGDFPFYYVQIAPFDYGANSHSELLREVQLKSLKTIPNSGMAVTMDIATIKGIHPPNKEAVGKRLVSWALAKDYGIKDVAVSGPLYTKMMIEDQEIRLYFDYAKNGLEAVGGELTNFEIAGNDHKFVPAIAIIENNTVVVSNLAVPEPVAVRYGWSNTATPNLFNTEGLPASSFRTDNWDK